MGGRYSVFPPLKFRNNSLHVVAHFIKSNFEMWFYGKFSYVKRQFMEFLLT